MARPFARLARQAAEQRQSAVEVWFKKGPSSLSRVWTDRDSTNGANKRMRSCGKASGPQECKDNALTQPIL